MSGNIIQLDQNAIHTELKDLVKHSVEETLNAMLDAEADRIVNSSVMPVMKNVNDIVPVITTEALLSLPERSTLEYQN